MPYVDLHLHLLPGVDDGPPDEAASLVHAERLAREGVHEATVTPHIGHPEFRLDVASIADRTRALQATIDAAGIDLLLHPGGEVYPGGATTLSPADLDMIAHGPRGARWVLFEVPFAGIDPAWLAACRHIRESGFSLLIAHPERASGFLTGGHELLRPELAAGALLQVNVSSLLGRHGPEARAGAVRLVRDGHAYVLASDGHGRNRADTLGAGPAAARAAGASQLRSDQLTAANPRFLLRSGMPREPAHAVDADAAPARQSRATGSAQPPLSQSWGLRAVARLTRARAASLRGGDRVRGRAAVAVLVDRSHRDLDVGLVEA